MERRKRRKLEAAGWRVSSAQEFLGLTDEEAVLIDLKLSLGRLVKSVRQREGLSQQELAGRISSSQSRVAKLEAGSSTVSLDLMVKAAFAAGAKKSDVARAIAQSHALPLAKA